MKRVRWKQKALRQLRKIKDKRERLAVYNAVGELANFPQCENVRKIKTTDLYRLRVGKWRVIFTPAIEIVTIEEVKRRNERTYQ